jgi:pimeloyl-ACP methyl ester carboxylesterase
MKNISTRLLFLLAASLLFSCSKQHGGQVTNTYVIVPGAWQASYAWQTVANELIQSGNKVVVVDLPGHGTDTTAPQNVSLDVYRDKVVSAINGLDGKVVLVGHSLAGMVISEVAEAIPSRIDRLIFVAAYLPVTGQSLLDLASTDTTSLLLKSIIPSEDMLTLGLVRTNIANIFIQDGTPAEQELVVSKYRLEPAIPFTNKVVLTVGNFGAVPKYYINTLQDHAVTPALQGSMLLATPVKQAYSINSGHSPFLSKPDSVTAILLNIGR